MIINYSIGLDIGDTSVGWAVMSDDYHLCKFKGKNMWGSRLFDMGTVAKERRIARGTRRRYNRRRYRVALLKELMGSIVLEKDKNFFMKLERGYFVEEDRGYKFNIFNDADFNDKDYYEKYPTIYHLRDALINSNEKMDPRLIYLALHHIIKYRGNFLYEHQVFNIGDSKEIETKLLDTVNEILAKTLAEDEDAEVIELNDVEIKEIIKVLCNKKLPSKAKKDGVKKVVANIKDKTIIKILEEITGLLSGKSGNISKIFAYCDAKTEDDKDYKLTFEAYDDKVDELEQVLQDEFYLCEALHEIYSYLVLNDILSEESSLSKAMVKSYDIHQKDLKELKSLIKQYCPNKYDEVFRSEKYYGAYIKSKLTKDEFYTNIKKLLDSIKEEEAQSLIEDIKYRIETSTYMPKQTQKENGAIPYQLHYDECEAILNAQGKFYPVLAENKDKILSLITFRVPYYVGPLNSSVPTDFNWVVRNHEHKPITPWNFEEEVDLTESAKRFITRMTNMCTYLMTEPVLPKNSLLYSKYCVLNELNKVRIDGELIKDKNVKEDIINTLFCTKAKVTHKDIKEFFLVKYQKEVKNVTGTQKEKEFASSLDSHRFYKKLYGADFDNKINEIEKLIEWSTVYEDAKIFKLRIQKEMPELYADKDKLNKIVKKRFTGWGRLSKKLLSGIYTDTKTLTSVTIMDIMEDTNENFMQIINNDKYSFKKEIEKYNYTNDEKITYDVIKQLQGSPANKKAIWQTIQIVEEIVDIMGHEPEQINIEFTRSEKIKQRTQSRVAKLKETYKNVEKSLDSQQKTVLSQLEKYSDTDRLDDEKLLLYFTQMGRCMYSGETLYLKDLSLYQVDHILPQSLIKDDSIENKVLVKAIENQNKGDDLVLDQNIRYKMKNYWKCLKDNGFIGEKKYRNLTRSKFSEEEELGFINRQLVETSQIIKHVANLFKNMYKTTAVMTIRANMSSQLRDKFDIPKIRDLNDYHHAQDAYLANVIGRFINAMYPKLSADFEFDNYHYYREYLKRDIKELEEEEKTKKAKEPYNFIIRQMSTRSKFNKDSGELVWEGQDTINLVKSICNYKDCLITRKTEVGTGQMFNLTVISAEEAAKKPKHKVVPVNKNRADVCKYGGFASIEKAYGVAVEYQKGKKLIRTVVAMPIIYANDTKEKQMEYLIAETNDTVKIIKDRILLNTLMEVDGMRVYMASESEWTNAVQLIMDNECQHILKKILMDEEKFQRLKLSISNDEFMKVYDTLIEKIEKHYPMFKTPLNKLMEARDSFAVLDDNKKKNAIRELLKITKASKSNATIKIGNVSFNAVGRITTKTIDLNKTTFIHQSVTGLFEKKVKL